MEQHMDVFVNYYKPTKDQRIAELEATNAELLEALDSLMPWMGKAIADNVFKDCVRPDIPAVVFAKAREAITKATS